MTVAVLGGERIGYDREARRGVGAWHHLRVGRGGVRYSHGTLRVAANPERLLRERHPRDVA